MELPTNFYTSLAFWAQTHFWLLALILRRCLSNVWAPSPLWVTPRPRIPTPPQAQTGLSEQTSALPQLGLHTAQAPEPGPETYKALSRGVEVAAIKISILSEYMRMYSPVLKSLCGALLQVLEYRCGCDTLA